MPIAVPGIGEDQRGERVHRAAAGRGGRPMIQAIGTPTARQSTTAMPE